MEKVCYASSSPKPALAWTTLAFFAGFAGVSAFGPIVPKLKESMALSPLLMGLLGASPALTGSLLRIPFGEDACSLDIQPGSWVLVRSRRGEARVRAVVGDSVPRGVVFMAMHYEETNRLTFPAFDPRSREPSYKYAAVNIRPA